MKTVFNPSDNLYFQTFFPKTRYPDKLIDMVWRDDDKIEVVNEQNGFLSVFLRNLALVYLWENHIQYVSNKNKEQK